MLNTGAHSHTVQREVALVTQLSARAPHRLEDVTVTVRLDTESSREETNMISHITIGATYSFS